MLTWHAGKLSSIFECYHVQRAGDDAPAPHLLDDVYVPIAQIVQMAGQCISHSQEVVTNVHKKAAAAISCQAGTEGMSTFETHNPFGSG